MKLGTEFDSLHGIGTTYSAQDGKLVMRQEGDAQPGIEYAKAKALDPEAKRHGIKESLMEALFIPNPVALEIIGKHGFNVFEAHPTEILRFIESHPEYHHCKTINGRLA